MRKAVIGFAAVLVVALTATVASAGNAHLKEERRRVHRQWPHADGHGELRGPRELRHAADPVSDGEPHGDLHQPRGATQPPGQNPAAVT